VREAWDSIPGDSEAAVDYPTEGAVEPSQYHEISVEMIVRTPDGVTLRYEESVEKGDPTDYSLDEILEVADSVTNVMTKRLGG